MELLHSKENEQKNYMSKISQLNSSIYELQSTYDKAYADNESAKLRIQSLVKENDQFKEFKEKVASLQEDTNPVSLDELYDNLYHIVKT